MRVRSVFVPVACAAVLFFASSSSARAVNKTGAPGASKRASGAAATAQVRSSTATQQALVDEARRAGYAVEWDGALAVPNSIRGADLSTRQAFSTGRGLAAIGRGQYAEDAVAVMDNLAGLFRITNAAEEFRSRKTQGDALGFHHVRLQQMYRGLPVVGGEVIVHFNKADAAYEVNGRYVPDLAVGIAPALDAARALAIAQADLQALKKPVGALDEAVSLVVYAREDPPRLAQALTLTYRDAAGEAGRWRYWIDALDGSILQRFNDIHNIPPPSGSGSPATITGALLAGESGVVTNFIGWHDSINPYYYLHNTSRVWIVENVAASGYPDANTYAHRTTNDWGTSDRVEISAARNFDVTLNYYRQRHALFSFDGAGAMARANVHEGVNYVNAYWDGDEFYFGDGDGVIANSLAVLDVCGHEFAHAVTEYSADLVYAGESGALNESFSDVMGTCVEFFGQADDRVSYPAKNPGRADWLMGEDCWLISTALRDMRNPANTVTVGAGSQQPTRYQGTHWDPLQEVHQNSGVQNFFFYLLCDGGNGNNDGINYSVTGIGITNAEQVAHRALTVYCTPNTGYRAVRGAWLSAALDLNPAWASAVRAAWDAVGVQPVSITPAGSAAYTGSEGGPFLPATFVYTITNADNTAVGWGVSHTQAWVTVTPGGGSIPAFGSQAVTVSVSGVAAGLTSGTYLDLLIFTNSASASTDSRAVTLLVRPPVVLEFDLSTNPGWTTEGQWAYGVPHGLGSDPTAGATGTNVYGYNLAGAYPDDMPVYALTTHALDCSEYENLQLSFSRWLGVESAEYDHATLQISTNGTTWANVWDHAGLSFQDRSWQSFTYSIPQADGHRTVYLRWLMGPTDGSVTYSGWNLDDIRLHGTARDNMRVVPGDGLTSQGYEGGPFAPTNKLYSVINLGSNTLQWTATTTSAWFTVSSPGGSLAAGATATVSVALSPATTTLVPGQYQGTVTFSNATSGFRSSRPAALTVRAIPGEIGVTDSIPPANDLSMPFGDVIIGLSRTERITITNSDALHAIILSRISFGFYTEDFNDGLAQDWNEIVDADWNVVAGEYQAQSPFTRLMVSKYGGKSWTDVTAQMTCRRTGDATSSAALLLRATADFDDDVGSAYIFQISVTGSYGIWKQVGGSWSWLQSWTTSPAIQPGVNVLRATAQGSALSFYINGTLVWSGSDSSLAGGLVGVAGYTEGDTTHYFDDVMAGDSLPTMATVSPAQAALNAQSVPGGDPRQAPPSTGAVSRASATVGAQSIISGAYRITNEPASFPYAIPAQSSIWFDVLYTPTTTVSNGGEVVIENNDADEPEVRVALSGRGILDYLTISPATGLVSSGHPGGPFSPINLAYVLTNSAAVPVTWTATHTQAWVTVSPAGDTLGAGAAQSVTVSLNAGAETLAVGVYQDTVVFSNATTGIRQTRPVTLTVFTSPQIAVTPADMWVTNRLGASTNRVLTVANGAAADGDLTFRLTSRSTGQSPLPFDGDAFVSQIQPGHDFTKVAPGEAFVPGELLVRFAAGMTGAARATLLTGLGGGEVRREYRIVPGLALVKLPPATKVEEALARFNGVVGIVYAEPNYTVQAFDTTPNDARFGELWGLHNTGQSGGTADADIDAPAAWDSQTGSTNVIVCVIDTGIDYNHEDLAANMWRNPGEIPANSIDDDNNGYVDDVYGINAITGSGNPMDDNDHGTHVSGTVGGLGNNSVGVAGVNWRVSLMAAKFLSSGGSGSLADALTCIEYATEMGAKVLSNSWGGGGYSQAMKDAIDVAGAAEIAFVAAAGNANSNNDSTPSYPSNYESTNVIAVMSTDRNDLKSSFSSYGQTTVDLAAPGTDILSCKRGGGYVVFSGTSMATPHVAGAAGLLLSVNPFATVAELKQALMSTVDVLFPTRCVSGGRLNLTRALNEMRLPWLSFSSTSVTNLPPGVATNIQVGFHAGELAPAIYHGEIVVSGNDLTNPVVRVPVHMTVLRDALVINPATGFASSGIIGGPFTPTGIVYTVSNSGPASVTWSLAHSGTWLSTSSSGGTLAPSAVNAVTVTVNAAAASLVVSNYSDTLAFANALSGAVQNRQVALSILPTPPEVIYSFPLDTNPGWSTDGQWAFGVPLGQSGDPSSGFTGPSVYGYNLAGAYANNIPVYALTTPALNCSGYTGLSLAFRRWLRVESASFDHATVQVSTNGVNWVTVWDHVGGSLQDASWQSVSYDISAVADNAAALRIRWLMGPTDGSVVHGGWNIDDIQVLGRPADSLDALQVSPAAGLSSSGNQGGPFAPSNKIYTLTNVGTSNLTWTATAASNWVSVAPGSGSLATGGTTNVTVTINANANALAIGAYYLPVVFSNGLSGVVQNRQVALSILPDPPKVIYSFPLDTNPGWSTDGQWAFGVPLGQSGDPSSGFTGPNVYGYNLAGAYANNIPVYALTTPALNCSGYTGVSLSFRRWLRVERAAFDHATLQVSTNGVNWVTVWDHAGSAILDTSWQSVTYDISAVADNAAALRIRWLMGPTDGSLVFGGWNLDDVQVLGRDGAIAFASATNAVAEGGGTVTIMVVRSGNTNLAATVNVATSNGTAVAGSDYAATNATLTFTAGQTNRSFAVSILNDAQAEVSETFYLRLSNPTGGGALGAPSVAALTIVDDDGVPTGLPINLNDGHPYLWDIQPNGSISNGTVDAYDGGHVLLGFPNFTNGFLATGGREVVIGPTTNAGVRTTRRIYVPGDQAFARFMEVLRNIGASAVTNRVRLDTDLGSGVNTVLVGTSDGDTAFETNDNWIVTDDTDDRSDPTMLHVIANDHGSQRPSAVSYSSDLLGYEYAVVLNPGETKIVMHFGAQNQNRSTATNKAPELTELGLGALAGISAEDLARIVNFGLPQPVVTSKGTPVTWLILHGLTNDDWNVEDNLDIDLDGLSAWQEYVADTDPTNPASVLSFTYLTRTGDTLRIDWKGGQWATQYIEALEQLGSTSAYWNCIRTNGVLPTPITNSLTDPVVTNRTYFYRIKAIR